ncbi:MAG: phosphatidylserine decarboxylase [Candidatus Hydrogenedentota bacterium]
MKTDFCAWRAGARYYVPLLVIGGLGLVLGWPGPFAWLGGVALLAGLASLGFFRDPPRPLTAQVNEAVAPADGKIVAVDELEDSAHFPGPCQRVTIFLSILDVHVNRAPLAGTVREVRFHPGLFLNALDDRSSEENESNTVLLDTAYGPVGVRQISGLIARTIVCAAKEGDSLVQGQRFGMIKFGSRTELYLPPEAEIVVERSAKVKAGRTIMARLP